MAFSRLTHSWLSKTFPHLIFYLDLHLTYTMYEPRGKALLVAVSVLTSLGFMLIGFDNGLMGGLGMFMSI